VEALSLLFVPPAKGGGMEIKMKQIDKGVTERVLTIAKKEFLKNGYQKASLRKIASQADTSPKSIYTRFADKENLFGALVEQKVQEFKKIMLEQGQEFSSLGSEKQRMTAITAYDPEYNLIDYIYDDFDTFKLILMCSQGTKYEHFLEELSEIIVELTLKFAQNVAHDALTSGRASRDIIHILCGSYLTGVFEPVYHNMDRNSALIYAKQLKRFFDIGWADLFDLPHPYQQEGR